MEWTSVEDFAPAINESAQHSDEVLVFTDGEEYYTGFYFPGNDHMQEHWFLGDGWMADMATVTHWMQLPDPPSPESEHDAG